MQTAVPPTPEPHRPPSPPDVRGQAMVGAPRARPERLLSRLRGSAGAACTPMFRALGYERIERPVAGVEKAVKGLLFDCRMCGQCVLELHRHVLPDELSQSPCAMGPAAACAPTAIARSSRTCAASGSRPTEGSETDPGRPRVDGASAVRGRSTRQGRSSWLGWRARKPRQSAAPGLRHEVRGRTGSGLSAADSARPYVAGALRDACCARAALPSPPNWHRRIPPIPKMCTSARGFSTAMSTPSMRPTAAAQTATCRAWRCARC